MLHRGSGPTPSEAHAASTDSHFDRITLHTVALVHSARAKHPKGRTQAVKAQGRSTHACLLPATHKLLPKAGLVAVPSCTLTKEIISKKEQCTILSYGFMPAYHVTWQPVTRCVICWLVSTISVGARYPHVTTGCSSCCLQAPFQLHTRQPTSMPSAPTSIWCDLTLYSPS